MASNLSLAFSLEELLSSCQRACGIGSTSTSDGKVEGSEASCWRPPTLVGDINAVLVPTCKKIEEMTKAFFGIIEDSIFSCLLHSRHQLYKQERMDCSWEMKCFL